MTMKKVLAVGLLVLSQVAVAGTTTEGINHPEVESQQCLLEELKRFRETRNF
jgi:hypothetical protein